MAHRACRPGGRVPDLPRRPAEVVLSTLPARARKVQPPERIPGGLPSVVLSTGPAAESSRDRGPFTLQHRHTPCGGRYLVRALSHSFNHLIHLRFRFPSWAFSSLPMPTPRDPTGEPGPRPGRWWGRVPRPPSSGRVTRPAVATVTAIRMPWIPPTATGSLPPGGFWARESAPMQGAGSPGNGGRHSISTTCGSPPDAADPFPSRLHCLSGGRFDGRLRGWRDRSERTAAGGSSPAQGIVATLPASGYTFGHLHGVLPTESKSRGLRETRYVGAEERKRVAPGAVAGRHPREAGRRGNRYRRRGADHAHEPRGGGTHRLVRRRGARASPARGLPDGRRGGGARVRPCHAGVPGRERTSRSRSAPPTRRI
jgi:hypothetical protein